MANILQLEEFYVQRMQVEFHPGDPYADSEDTGPDRMYFDYDVLFNSEEPDQWALVLSVRMAPPEDADAAGYELEAEVFGFFDTTGISPDSIEYLVRVNGAMMLYGLLRGQVAAITGSFPAGKLLLPSVDMTAVVDEVEARKVEELQAELKASTKTSRTPKAKSKAKSKPKPAAKKKSAAKKKPATKKGTAGRSKGH